jgi:hypothetical protein
VTPSVIIATVSAQLSQIYCIKHLTLIFIYSGTTELGHG